MPAYRRPEPCATPADLGDSIFGRINAHGPERARAGTFESQRIENAGARRGSPDRSGRSGDNAKGASGEDDARSRDVVRDDLAISDDGVAIAAIRALLDGELQTKWDECRRHERRCDETAGGRGAELLDRLVYDAAIHRARVDRPDGGAEEEVRLVERAVPRPARHGRVFETAEDVGLLSRLTGGWCLIVGRYRDGTAEDRGGEYDSTKKESLH